MAKSTDERGRIYLPKDVRERFGDEYRVVELPNYIALFPTDENPLEAVENAVGDALKEKSVSQLSREAREKAHQGIAKERDEAESQGE